MTVRDAIEQAYRNGYEAGVKSVTDNNVGDKMTPTDKDTNVPSKWIPVAERLPKLHGDYLTVVYCADGDKYVDISFWVGKYWVDLDGDKMDYDVTHWMPLPEPPKGE